MWVSPGKKYPQVVLPFAGRHQAGIASIKLHGKNLVTTVRRARGLKDQPGLIEGKVGFRVFSSRSQLSNVREVFFTRKRFNSIARGKTQNKKRKNNGRKQASHGSLPSSIADCRLRIAD